VDQAAKSHLDGGAFVSRTASLTISPTGRKEHPLAARLMIRRLHAIGLDCWNNEAKTGRSEDPTMNTHGVARGAGLTSTRAIVQTVLLNIASFVGTWLALYRVPWDVSGDPCLLAAAASGGHRHLPVDNALAETRGVVLRDICL
jgi:hypothetical protein